MAQAVPTLRQLMQEDHEVEASLDNTAKPSLKKGQGKEIRFQGRVASMVMHKGLPSISRTPGGRILLSLIGKIIMVFVNGLTV